MELEFNYLVLRSQHEIKNSLSRLNKDDLLQLAETWNIGNDTLEAMRIEKKYRCREILVAALKEKMGVLRYCEVLILEQRRYPRKWSIYKLVGPKTKPTKANFSAALRKVSFDLPFYCHVRVLDELTFLVFYTTRPVDEAQINIVCVQKDDFLLVFKRYTTNEVLSKLFEALKDTFAASNIETSENSNSWFLTPAEVFEKLKQSDEVNLSVPIAVELDENDILSGPEEFNDNFMHNVEATSYSETSRDVRNFQTLIGKYHAPLLGDENNEVFTFYLKFSAPNIRKKIEKMVDKNMADERILKAFPDIKDADSEIYYETTVSRCEE